jgi:hypothetical protein
MNNLKIVTLSASLIVSTLASGQTWNGSTRTAWTFNRPEVPSVGAPSVLSAVGIATHYQATTFTVPNSGPYTLATTYTPTFDGALTMPWDGVTYLYSGTFNAALPLANVLVGNDDSTTTSGNSTISSVSLMAGSSYVFVVAGFADADQGSYVVTLTKDATLDGAVTLGDYAGPQTGLAVSVQIRSVGSTTVVATTTTLDANGAYSVPTGGLAPGAYDVAVKVSHWLRASSANVTVSAAGAVAPRIELINGDADGDNEVSILDYVVLSTAYGTLVADPTSMPNADLDGDGEVTILDYLILSTSYGAEGV